MPTAADLQQSGTAAPDSTAQQCSAAANLSLQTDTSFLRLLDIDLADVGAHSNAIVRLRAGELTAIIVRGLYTSEFLTRTVERLERHDPPFVQTWFPEKFRSWFYGRNLNLLEVGFDSYFAEVPAFQQQLQEVFPEPDFGIQGHVLQTLSRLDQRRPYRAPGPDFDQAYMATTLRGHAEGGYIAAHCDNEQTMRPGYQHLQTIVRDHIYSSIVLLSKPLGGGQLEVYDWRTEPAQARLLNDDSVHDRPDLSQIASERLSLDAGDLVIVDSGRYLHRVTPVTGSRIRWTMCSFMAPARDRNAVYCWG